MLSSSPREQWRSSRSQFFVAATVLCGATACSASPNNGAKPGFGQPTTAVSQKAIGNGPAADAASKKPTPSAKPLELPLRTEDYIWYGIEREVIARRSDGRVLAHVYSFLLRHKTEEGKVLPFILQNGQPIEAPGRPLANVAEYQPEVAFRQADGATFEEAVEALRIGYLPPHSLDKLAATELRLVEERSKRVLKLAIADVPSSVSSELVFAHENWNAIERVADGVTVLKLGVDCDETLPSVSYIPLVEGMTDLAAQELVLAVAITPACGRPYDDVKLKKVDKFRQLWPNAKDMMGTPWVR